MKLPTTHYPLPTIPEHIAIIMDGNRRWAREHNLPVLEGHRRVTDVILEPLIEYAAKKGVKFMTFWAWSTENWKRDEKEVMGIMKLFKNVITRRLGKLHEKGVKVKVIGDISKFDPAIREGLENVVEKTKNNTTITVIFALNYGGRDEIVRAANKAIKADDCVLTTESFSKFLDTAGIPDPEIIVRTGGEQRLSGFLPWQSEYSELYFPSWYMPEFTEEKLDEVLVEYATRKRRFGK
ncbi:di-trans,poly-cis-decaprenylcistransferase [Candidatus Gottesmanbacteria bacterium]|nr:di-trans,poly-cis-decaprenylcistransferase [Candidatus Gottesmanbacteria bacterium]